MDKTSEHLIDSMNTINDFGMENCYDLMGNFQMQTDFYPNSTQQQLNNENLFQKELYYQNSSHIKLQNFKFDFPEGSIKNYGYLNQNLAKQFKYSIGPQQIYEKYHSEYLRRKRLNQIWQSEMKKMLLSLKLQIKIAQKLQSKRNDVKKQQKIDVGFQFPENQTTKIDKVPQILPQLCNQHKNTENFSRNYIQLCEKNQKSMKSINRIKSSTNSPYNFVSKQRDKFQQRELKLSSQQVIENIKILRTQKIKLSKPEFMDKNLRQASKKSSKLSKNQINLARKELKMKPSYQTIRILAQIYITQGYNYRTMEKIKYLEKDLKNLTKYQCQQHLRFKSVSNINNRDYSNFSILIVRFSLRQVQSLLIDFYGIQELTRIKYYEFDLIRIILLKFKDYFREKMVKVWLQIIGLMFELQDYFQIPEQQDLIDLYVELMKKLKSQIQVRVQKSDGNTRNQRNSLANRVSLEDSFIIDQESEQKVETKRQFLVRTSKQTLESFSRQRKEKKSSKGLVVDSGSQMQEIYEFTV